MGEVAPSVLLFSIAGGYAFLQLWHLTRHRWDALEWERNLFEATLVGSVLFLTTRLVVLPLERIEWFRQARDLIKAALPFVYSGSLLATLALGIFAGLVFRRFSSDEQAIRRAVRDYGGELLKLLQEAFESRTPVSISMRNRKVYVGLVIASPSLSTTYLYTKILPSVSGYRDDTQRINFTTSYWHVYEDLERRMAVGERPTVDVGSFGIVLPLEEIVSANFFDEDSYTRYFSPLPKHVPSPKEQPPSTGRLPGPEPPA